MDTRTGLRRTSASGYRPWGWPTRVAAAVGLAALMVAGIVVLGRLASNDVMAMVLTSIFFAGLAAALFWLLRSRRWLVIPLGGTFVLIAGTAGVVLGLPLITDDVVDEDVVSVQAPAQDEAGTAQDEAGTAQDEAGTAARALASGQFEARDHPGEGTATVVDTGDGAVLTLTEFATDNGPDLLVYLVPPDAPEGTVDGFVDLGPLRGNIGDQQYEIRDGLDVGPGWSVVIWCRAFAVNFTEAVLA